MYAVIQDLMTLVAIWLTILDTGQQANYQDLVKSFKSNSWEAIRNFQALAILKPKLENKVHALLTCSMECTF